MFRNCLLIIDFGTDSVRGLVVDAKTGQQAASARQGYPRWNAKLFCGSSRNRDRQYTPDYLERLEKVVRRCAAPLGDDLPRTVAVCLNITASTPALTVPESTPLALLEYLADNPDGMIVPWKNNTALPQSKKLRRRPGGGKQTIPPTRAADILSGLEEAQRVTQPVSSRIYRPDNRQKNRYHTC